MSSNTNVMDELVSNLDDLKTTPNPSGTSVGEAFHPNFNDCNSTFGDNESHIDSEDISFTGTLLGVMNDQDLAEISNVQTEVSDSLGALALKCQSFQEFSQVKYQDLSRRFETHTAATKELQQDLESIFKRIRAIKSKVMAQYPSKYNQVKKNLPDVVVEDD